jgi:hypothetical protein
MHELRIKGRNEERREPDARLQATFDHERQQTQVWRAGALFSLPVNT